MGCRCVADAFEDVYESPVCAQHSLNWFSRHQSQHHEDEKRALSREIIVLNNHLMEAKLTIEKLQEDNVGLFLSLRVLLQVDTLCDGCECERFPADSQMRFCCASAGPLQEGL